MTVNVHPHRTVRKAPRTAETISGPVMSSRSLSLSTGRGMLAGRSLTLIVVIVALPWIASMLGGYQARYALAISGALAIAVLASNIITATVGDVNLAIGAHMAIGAYGCAYGQLHGLSIWISVLIGIGASTLVAAVVSLGVVRLRGVYTALATFALAFCIPDAATYFKSITGGGTGEYLLPVTVGGVQFGNASLALNYLILAVFGALGLGWMWLLSGRLGRLLLMLGDSEPALEAFRHSSYRAKVTLWATSGLLAGIAGVLYGVTVGYLNPQQFTYFLSLELFIGSVVGGVTTVLGALLGGLLVGALPVYLSSTQGGVEDLVFGALLLAALALGRSGVWPRIEGLAVRAWTRARPHARGRTSR